MERLVMDKPNGRTATYSPDDNKLRLYSATRFDDATRARVEAGGFRWAPKQRAWVTPMWTPGRADLLFELCGTIEDDDSSLVERSEDRAARFDEYGAKRAEDADHAEGAARAIADQIPLGQPILIGHHSERRARRDAERIQSHTSRAVDLWKTAEYWKARAAAARRHAKYKERPDVRARRIRTIEADKRKHERARDRSQRFMAAWVTIGAGAAASPLPSPTQLRERAIRLANADGGYYRLDHAFPSGYVGPLSLWEAVGGSLRCEDANALALAAPEDVRDHAIKNHQTIIASSDRWIEHCDRRLTYERAMLEETGCTVADRIVPETGGACRCWASPRGAWSYIQRVNKVSVTVLDNWGNGGPNFSRTIPFDKLTDVMTKGDVEAARAARRIVEGKSDALGTVIGFVLRPPTNEP
jgi:hypothetical protein